ncbi:hypothetical protein [Avibacterium paragallinarum]|uniref:Uncharacterized protein n=1 Tax=Avibacterium paragallinarum TaxID=728 RepID=A0A8B3T7S8_AVIPA|nr:hypothetical protein [Avibacterium paragallinarum]RZN54021.1 hypothetical protein EIG79_12225 [Avibacterium paragallinarum]
MKEFNLEKALSGEPVKLRNGKKAYVKYQVDTKCDYPLAGYLIDGDGGIYHNNWLLDGRNWTDSKDGRDIIGMWEEPKPKRFINGIEVQQPLTMKTYISGEKYWCVDLESSELVTEITLYAFNTESLNLVTRGLAFRRKQDAKAMAKALLNYKVEVKNE